MQSVQIFVVAPAGAAEVVSSNVVGYQRMNLTAGWNMIGVQFVKVGTGEAKALPDAMTLDAGMSGFDEDGNYATVLKVWDGSNYTTYGWSGTSAGEYMDDPTLNNKWLDGDYQEVPEASLAAEDAIWIKAEKAGTVLVSGQVPTNTVVTVPLVAGWNMVANPFPKSVKVSTFGVLSSNMEGFDEDGNYATVLKVWDGNNYTTYGWSGTSAGEYMDDSTLNNKWLDGDYQETNDNVDFGHGVWIKAGSAGTITFTAE